MDLMLPETAGENQKLRLLGGLIRLHLGRDVPILGAVRQWSHITRGDKCLRWSLASEKKDKKKKLSCFGQDYKSILSSGFQREMMGLVGSENISVLLRIHQLEGLR